MTDDEAGEPAVRSFVRKLITDFVIHIDGAKLPGEFDGQEKCFARGSDSTTHRVVRVVEEKLGKNRDIEAGLSAIVKTPFDAGVGLTLAKFSSRRRTLHAQPGALISQLDAIPDPEIDVDVGYVGNGLI